MRTIPLLSGRTSVDCTADCCLCVCVCAVVGQSHPGGQLFYDSLYAQYAEWGVDFIKNDCVYAQFVPDQIDAVSAAMENSGRRMLYSLSPGSDDPTMAARIVDEVNMYRVTDDTWDRWANSIANHWRSAEHMQPYIGKPNGRSDFYALSTGTAAEWSSGVLLDRSTRPLTASCVALCLCCQLRSSIVARP